MKHRIDEGKRPAPNQSTGSQKPPSNVVNSPSASSGAKRAPGKVGRGRPLTKSTR
ncbi:MAG: hypothetical protein WKG07_39265 [Hymenobacter sp.]